MRKLTSQAIKELDKKKIILINANTVGIEEGFSDSFGTFLIENVKSITASHFWSDVRELLTKFTLAFNLSKIAFELLFQLIRGMVLRPEDGS